MHGASSTNGATAIDPAQAARQAGLRYVSDRQPGIQRLGEPGKFRYVGADEESVRDAATLERIRKIAIPPAWTAVWICPIANGHLQATGRDSKGRKQYRYHARWTEIRNETKFGRAIAFGETLPRVRARVERDLAQHGLPRTKVMAAVVQLLQDTMIRIGNPEYARDNDSYGLTTLRDRHVQVAGTTLRFRFRGKSGKDLQVDLRDRRLARVVKRCKELPGSELFQYVDDDGQPHSIGSEDVNDYLREITGQDFSAKDFRAWGGTVLAAAYFYELGSCETRAPTKKWVVECIKRVSSRLGNTPTVCRKYYVHPAIVDAYTEGQLYESMRAQLARRNGHAQGLAPEERAVLDLLKRAQARSAEAA